MPASKAKADRADPGWVPPADDTVERRLCLDDHLIQNPESTFLVRVSGDALAGVGFLLTPHGDFPFPLFKLTRR
ncbi:MAG: hypothetical protein P9F75_17860 [Candidatus Contendobacter sp.]|nr:hypothetical protein [Candidatus Contendobacter sp.]